MLQGMTQKGGMRREALWRRKEKPARFYDQVNL
jgi:hypothetical protein